MSISELQLVISPPMSQTEVGNAAKWATAEAILGTALPRDYFEFASHYGTGYLCNFWNMEILNPFSDSYHGRLRSFCKLLRYERGLGSVRSRFYGVFPDSSGWLLWGYNDVGIQFCWVTEGVPDEWPILVIDKQRTFQQFHMPLTTFLAELITGHLRIPFLVMNEYTPDDTVQFRSLPPRAGATTSTSQPSLAFWSTQNDTVHCPWDGEWFPSDELGRPTGGRVVFGPGTPNVPWNGFASAEFTMYPNWWHELPSPLYKWQRGQLIGWRLGGMAGSAMYNMIPLTWKAQRILRAMEGGAATQVSLGARVRCTVRTVYEGSNRYPARLLIESSSTTAALGTSGGWGPIAIENV